MVSVPSAITRLAPTLQSADFCENKILNYSSVFAASFPVLNTLGLSYNKIQEFDILKGLGMWPNLTHLEIDGNRLTYLPNLSSFLLAKTGRDDFVNIEAGFNDFHCNESLAWVLQNYKLDVQPHDISLIYRSIRLKYVDDVICDTPETFRGLSLWNFTEGGVIGFNYKCIN